MSDNEYTPRSKRSRIPKKEDNTDLLNCIKSAKNAGRNHKEVIKVDDIYDYVDQETYNKLKMKRQEEDENDDGKEMFDSSSDEEIMKNNKNLLKRKKSVKNINVKNSKLNVEVMKPVGRNPFVLMGKAKNKTSNASHAADIEDLLSELSSTTKTSAPNAPIDNPFVNKTKPSTYNINKPKIISHNNFTPNEALPKSTKKQSTLFDNKINKSEILSVESQNKLSSDNQSIIENNIKISPIKITDIPKKEDLFHDDFVDFDDDDDFNEVTNENFKKGFTHEIKVQKIESVWLNEENKIENTNNVVDESFSKPSNSDAKEFFMFDAFHDKNIPDVIFLFGKMYDNNTNSFANCCVRVNELRRRFYFLPKADYSTKDVFDELLILLSKLDIHKFYSKVVTKKYSFQFTDVPNESEYLNVEYDMNFPELSNDFTGQTFSHVFGINTPPLETFILDLKLKGPCWLKFNNLELVSNKFSNCKFDYNKKGMVGIIKSEGKVPPLSVLSLNIKTVTNKTNNNNEIVSIGCFMHNNIYFDQPPPVNVYQKHFTILTHPKDTVMPYDLTKKISEWGSKYSDVFIEPNEKALINRFLAKLLSLDPDLIVGHSLFGYQLEIFLQRCQALNITFWHRLSRLKRKIALPKIISGKVSSMVKEMATAGRMVCDIAFSAQELVKCRSYELYDIVKEILPPKFHCLQDSASIDDLNNLFIDSSKIKQLIDMTMDEALSNIYLMHELQILPLAHQITVICGNLISRALSSGKSERIEYLLLHAFNEKDYIVPDKAQFQLENKHVKTEIDDQPDQDQTNHSKRKPTYAGGLVLEPKRGFYENFILLMDFNSLYPSIICEFNICFTTIDRMEYLKLDESVDINSPDIAYQQMEVLMKLSDQAKSKPPGILPTEIRKLVDSRKLVKNLLLAHNLTKEQKMQYDIRQKALKITANSMYGCLGYSRSRFQATQLAALVTARGRDILMKTKDQVASGSIKLPLGNVNSNVLDIIYGDTDSIMVNTGISKLTDYDQVMKIGQRIKEAVNGLYKEIQLDIDGVLRRILLLNKKKYAALTVVNKDPKTGLLVTKQELKGLDIVRRDWCKLAIEVGKEVVTKILEGEMAQEDLVISIHNYLKSVSDDVRAGKIDLNQFVITKALSRNPDNYTNKQGQPHVLVALRLNKSGVNKQFRAKDTVEYAICIDGTTENATQRAYSPIEIINSYKNKSNNLIIDCNYYLAHQLHPVVCRLVECIDGLSHSSIAEHLGLDPSGYRNRQLINSTNNEDNNKNGAEEDAILGDDKYKDCRPLVLQCSKCQTKTKISNPILNTNVSLKSWNCDTCQREFLSTKYDAVVISKQICLLIRRIIHLHYSSVVVCGELECKYICRELPIVCHINNDRILDQDRQQLCPRCGYGIMKPVVSDSQLYKQLSFYKYLFSTKDKMSLVHSDLLAILTNEIDRYLNASAYVFVDLQHLFSTLIRSKKIRMKMNKDLNED